MRIDVVSVMPRFFESALENGLIKQAIKKGIAQVFIHNLHDYATNAYKQVDDKPFGGGSGMILMCPPVFACIEKLKAERTYDDVIFLSPDAATFDQRVANELSLKGNLIFLCGHYKGIDERIRQTLITKEYSLGDFVLSGGELPALVVMDAMLRLLPGVLGDAESALLDSFQDGKLDFPHYTRPAEFRGMSVPDVLMSGNHKEIEKWQQAASIAKTQERRPDLLQ
jgi:tRNA (guanine37-N1)-methyltransferase